MYSSQDLLGNKQGSTAQRLSKKGKQRRLVSAYPAQTSRWGHLGALNQVSGPILAFMVLKGHPNRIQVEAPVLPLEDMGST